MKKTCESEIALQYTELFYGVYTNIMKNKIQHFEASYIHFHVLPPAFYNILHVINIILEHTHLQGPSLSTHKMFLIEMLDELLCQ